MKKYYTKTENMTTTIGENGLKLIINKLKIIIDFKI
jgi:hypothetical protein